MLKPVGELENGTVFALHGEIYIVRWHGRVDTYCEKVVGRNRGTGIRFPIPKKMKVLVRSDLPHGEIPTQEELPL